MIRRSLVSIAPRLGPQTLLLARRALTVSKSPGSDPLEVLQQECIGRNLCDEHGRRLPGVHWVFSLAMAPEDSSKPPNLRTIGIERVSSEGVDFVMKRGSATAKSVAAGRPVAFLHAQGKMLPGEHSEQWRGEGHCHELPLDSVIELVPHYTLTSMVGSKRMALELASHEPHDAVSTERLLMWSKSHFTEIVQKVRLELENGDVTMEELEQCVEAFRFQPDRLETMVGSPDSLFWERWEWLRDTDAGDEASIVWNEANRLVPH